MFAFFFAVRFVISASIASHVLGVIEFSSVKLDLSLLFLPPLCYWDFSYSVTTRAFFVDPVRLKTNNGGCFSPFLARFVSIFNFTSRHVIDDALTHLARYLRKCSCLYLIFLLFCPDSVPACIYFSSCFVQTCQCSCLYLLQTHTGCWGLTSGKGTN